MVRKHRYINAFMLYQQIFGFVYYQNTGKIFTKSCDRTVCKAENHRSNLVWSRIHYGFKLYSFTQVISHVYISYILLYNQIYSFCFRRARGWPVFLCLTPSTQSYGNNTENSIFFHCGCKNISLHGPDCSELPFQNERRLVVQVATGWCCCSSASGPGAFAPIHRGWLLFGERNSITGFVRQTEYCEVFCTYSSC